MFAPPLDFSERVHSPRDDCVQENEPCFSSCQEEKRIDSLISVTTEATQMSSEPGCSPQDLEGLEPDVLLVYHKKRTISLMVERKNRGMHCVESSPDLYAMFSNHAREITITEFTTRAADQEHSPDSNGPEREICLQTVSSALLDSLVPAKPVTFDRHYEELSQEATDRVLVRNQALLCVLAQLEKELEPFSLREMKWGKPVVPMRPPRRSKLLARRSLGS